MRNDPWSLGGLALLALLSLGVLLVYRSAPQSMEQVRTRTVLAARPSAFGPRLAQAEERLRAAEAAAREERDSAAVAAFSEAVDHAARAAELAGDDQERRAATDLWGEALLGWAERLRLAGTGQGIRPDDHDTLRRALELVDRVLAASPSADLRARADALAEQLRRQLRIGPLEWLPLPR